ncbi:hypothetical protein amrb99_24740 [Actinomadura sp. RB99]|uniref:hypothetical protein n=1 Tax=Actinomadura sp. RB99 TaxID=2691577 RepID=UPI0016895AB5|nr:hypothetical protein [Actinomadura sp. RB99]MBD2893552.1 hypothetical protein [Actinomadura sp. RB99]
MNRPTHAELSTLSATDKKNLVTRWIADDIITAYGGTLRYARGTGVGFWRTDGPLADALSGGPDIDAEIVRRVNPLQDEYRAATGHAIPWNIQAHNAVKSLLRDDRRVWHQGGRREITAYYKIAKTAARDQ